MPRPKRVSNEEIFAAALGLLERHGLNGFTLTDAANAVGLSRPAIIQRFGDRDGLLRRLAAYEVEATRAYVESFDLVAGPQGLWRFLSEIVRSMGTGKGFSVRVTMAALEANDPDLRAKAFARYSMVQSAVAARLPGRADAGEIALFLHGVIAGASMQWVTQAEGDLSAYVLKRLGFAFRLIFPDENVDGG